MTYDLYYLIPQILVFFLYYGVYISSVVMKKYIYSTRYSIKEIDFEMFLVDMIYIFINMNLLSSLPVPETGFSFTNLDFMYFPFALVTFITTLFLWRYIGPKKSTK